jgi:hypothetical protein
MMSAAQLVLSPSSPQEGRGSTSGAVGVLCWAGASGLVVWRGVWRLLLYVTAMPWRSVYIGADIMSAAQHVLSLSSDQKGRGSTRLGSWCHVGLVPLAMWCGVWDAAAVAYIACDCHVCICGCHDVSSPTCVVFLVLCNDKSARAGQRVWCWSGLVPVVMTCGVLGGCCRGCNVCM